MLPLCHQEQNVSGSSSSRNIVGYSSKLKVEAQPRLSGKSIVFKALANLCLPAVDEKSSKTREIEADATPTNTLLLLCYYPPPTQEAAFLLYSMIKKTFGRMHFPFFFSASSQLSFFFFQILTKTNQCISCLQWTAAFLLKRNQIWIFKPFWKLLKVRNIFCNPITRDIL